MKKRLPAFLRSVVVEVFHYLAVRTITRKLFQDITVIVFRSGLLMDGKTVKLYSRVRVNIIYLAGCGTAAL